MPNQRQEPAFCAWAKAVALFAIFACRGYCGRGRAWQNRPLQACARGPYNGHGHRAGRIIRRLSGGRCWQHCVSAPWLRCGGEFDADLSAEQRIVERLADGILVNPSVFVRVAELRPVQILGDVRAPGSYPFRYGSMVKSAIAQAGGLGTAERGSAISDLLLADERVRTLGATIRRPTHPAGSPKGAARWRQDVYAAQCAGHW